MKLCQNITGTRCALVAYSVSYYSLDLSKPPSQKAVSRRREPDV